MKYPKCNQHLTISHSNNQYEITNYLSGETHVTNSIMLIRLLKCLDGKTNPYQYFPRSFVKESLMIFKEANLLEDKRIRFVSTLTLFKPKVISDKVVKLSRLINIMLNILFLPSIIIGLNICIKNEFFLKDLNVSLTNTFFSLFICLMFHEIGHGVAAISYNPKCFYELGVGLIAYFIPFGYVAYESSDINSWFKRIQVLAAGVQMNCILFALSTLIYIHSRNNFIAITAINSLLMAMLNISLFAESDGSKILLQLLSIDNEKKAVNNTAYKIINKIRMIGSCTIICLNFWGIITWFL